MQREEEAPGAMLSRTGSVTGHLPYGLHVRLAPGLRPQAWAPRTQACPLLPLPLGPAFLFLHRPFGITRIRQGVDVAVNSRPLWRA